MIYFAYGSNMSHPRLANRIDVVEKIGIHELKGYQLKFHMHGQDDSAKCDAHFTGNKAHSVLGVLFRINPLHREILDVYEGLGVGYERYEFDVEHLNKPAFLYTAKKINTDLRPFCWYKHHVVHGAIEANLPESYINSIRSVADLNDKDEARRKKEMSIY